MTKGEGKGDVIDLEGLLAGDEDFLRAAVEALVQVALFSTEAPADPPSVFSLFFFAAMRRRTRIHAAKSSLSLIICCRNAKKQEHGLWCSRPEQAIRGTRRATDQTRLRAPHVRKHTECAILILWRSAKDDRPRRRC